MENSQQITSLSQYIIDALNNGQYHFAWAVFHTLMAKVDKRGQQLSNYKVNEDGFLIYSNESRG